MQMILMTKTEQRFQFLVTILMVCDKLQQLNSYEKQQCACLNT